MLPPSPALSLSLSDRLTGCAHTLHCSGREKDGGRESVRKREREKDGGRESVRKREREKKE
jgi:hypothetical protein